MTVVKSKGVPEHTESVDDLFWFYFSSYVLELTTKNGTITELKDYKWRCLSHIAQKGCTVHHLLVRHRVQTIQTNNPIRFFLDFVAQNYLSMDCTFSHEDFLQRRLGFLLWKSLRHIAPTLKFNFSAGL